MAHFICYPKCSTCQKAKKWLDDNGIAYTLRDIKLENPTAEELAQWHAKSGLPLKKFFNTSGLLYKSLELKEWHLRSGLPLKKFFNTSGLLYKSLNLKEKLPTMSEEEQLRLLASDGMLVKRPLVVLEDRVMTGFREAEWKETLK